MGKILQKIYVGVTGTLFVIAFVFSFMSVSDAKARLANANSEYDTKVAEAQKEVSLRETKLNTAIQEVTGFDRSRKTVDDGVAKKVLNGLYTWSSTPEYMEGRKLVAELGFEGKDQELQELMPELDAENGSVIEEQKMTSELTDVETYVIDIKDNTYSYLAKVSVEAASNDHSKGKSYAVVTYSVTHEGETPKMRDVKVYHSNAFDR